MRPFLGHLTPTRVAWQEGVAIEEQDESTNVSCVIPGRTITGAPAEVLTEIDEIVESLLAVRQIVASKNLRSLRSDLRQNGTLPMVR